MAKYHDGKNGIAPCEATVKNCPLEHFEADSQAGAQQKFEQSMNDAHGEVPIAKALSRRQEIDKMQEIRGVQDLRDELDIVNEKAKKVDVIVDEFSDPNITDDHLVWNMPEFPESVRTDLDTMIVNDLNDGVVSDSMTTSDARAYQLDLLRPMQEYLHDDRDTARDRLEFALMDLSDEDREVALRPTPKKQLSDSVSKDFDSYERTGLAFKSKQEFFEESKLSATDFSHAWTKLVQDGNVGDRDSAAEKMGLRYLDDGVSRKIGKLQASPDRGSDFANSPKNSLLMRSTAKLISDGKTEKWIGSVEQHFDNSEIGEKPSTRNCPHDHRNPITAQKCSDKMLAKLKKDREVPSSMSEKEFREQTRKDPWN